MKGQEKETLDVLGRVGRWKIRTYLMPYREFAMANDLGLRTGFGDDRLRLGAVKLFMDGSIQCFTCAFREPYVSQDTRGWEGLRHSQDKMSEMVGEAHALGWQVAIHAQGDLGISMAVSAIEHAMRAHPRRDPRHRIEHTLCPTLEDLERMRRLGIIPNLFLFHPWFWGDQHIRDFIGPERARRMVPARTAMAMGLRPCANSDCPVCTPDDPVWPSNPLWGMACAVTRTTRGGLDIGSDERITPLQALRKGWKPEGVEGKRHISAEEFLERESLFGRIHKQDKALKRLEGTLEEMTKQHKKIAELERKEVLDELKSKKKEALENADYDAVFELDERIDDAKQVKTEEISHAKPDPDYVHPDFPAWHERNPWYNPECEPELFEAAEIIGQGYVAKHPNAAAKDVFEYVEKTVKRMHPEKFERQTTRRNAVESGQRNTTTRRNVEHKPTKKNLSAEQRRVRVSLLGCNRGTIA